VIALYETLEDSLSFQYTGGEKSIKLPAVRVKWFRIRATDWQVTDAGIAAGETLGGTIGEVEIKRKNKQTVFYSYDDELDETVQYCEGASPFSAPSTTGLYSDPQPTTATDEDTWWTFYGPFNWKGSCKLRISQDAFTTEFGAASAGYVTYEIDYEVYTGLANDIIVTREYSASATKHNVYGTDNPILLHAIFVAGTADYVSKITLNHGGTSVFGDNTPQKFAADFDMEFRSTAQTTLTKYLLKNLRSEHPDREFIIAMSTAATLTAYFIGVDPY
jgi:hypothetical protein